MRAGRRRNKCTRRTPPDYRIHARRLGEGIKAATVIHEISEAQLRIFRADWGLAAARNLEWFEEERAREFLGQLPVRPQERLIEAMETILEIFERDAITNRLERAREA